MSDMGCYGVRHMSTPADPNPSLATEAVEAYEQQAPADTEALAKMWLSRPFSHPYVAPPAPGFDREGVWHCLGGETRVVTWDGAVPIRELADRTARVVTIDDRGYPNWAEARFRSFGTQALYRITLTRNGIQHVVRATAGHRWFVAASRTQDTGRWREETTASLRPGDRMRSVRLPGSGNITVSPWGAAHGFAFGDGNYEKNSVRVILWGDKDRAMSKFYPLSPQAVAMTENGVEGIRIDGLPRFFKGWPDLDETPSYLYGWLAGYFAADGCVDETGHPTIASVNKENIEAVRRVCLRLGIFTYAPRPSERREYSDGVIWHMGFGRSSLSADFFLLDKHRERWIAGRQAKERRTWKVVSVEPDATEEVFCGEVPGTHNFALEEHLLTGNCFNTSSRSGYSTHAVSLQWMLEHLGVETMLTPHRNLDIDIEKFPKDRYDLLFKWHKNAVGRPRLLFVSFPPDVAASLGEMGPPLVPYCAFEGTQVSTFSRDLCNGDAFRAVWVVSTFVRDAMIAGGVKPEKVHAVPPVLYGGPWSTDWFVDLDAASIRNDVSEERPFTFGAIGTWHSRKGFPDLIRAYWTAFERTDPVQLVLRTSQFGEDANLTIRKFGEKLTADVAKIAREFGDDRFPTSKALPRIRVITGTDAPDQEIVEWIGTLDAYANATYGEGLGIPHVWAKAQGVPMVSTLFGAVGDLLVDLAMHGSTEDVVVPYRPERIEPDMVKFSLMFDRDCEWGRYDIADLAKGLRAQFERGRRIDAHGARRTRFRFGVEETTRLARAALERTLTEEEAGYVFGAGTR